MLQSYFCAGEMAERSNAAVLKTVEVKASGGSNPSLSAFRSRIPGIFFMPFYAYILISENTQRRYFGSCGDLEKRLKYHNSGKVKSTRPYRPYRVLYYEIFESKSEAIKRERFFKTI